MGKQQAEKIEADYKKTTVKTAGKGAAGVGAGVAVVTMGPTAAMGVATTFGVASTGTAISSLSGVAATNAALAWRLEKLFLHLQDLSAGLLLELHFLAVE